MSSSLFTRDFSTDPYWWDDAPLAELPDRSPPSTVDVLVIGSGYTGLNAALCTARGGRETLVLEANAPGWGCSTRNGGQVSTSVKGSFKELARAHGPDAAANILSEGHNALAWLGDFVGTEAIDCGFHVSGRFHAAHNPRAYEQLARGLSANDGGPKVEAHLVPRSEQLDELGSEAYHGGVVFSKHACLHPGQYHAGLLSRVLEAGATVIAHCPVTSIEKNGAGFRVETARGPVQARDVVVATNGYTQGATPWHQRRVIPIGSYIIATEPLAPELMNRLMPRNRITSDTRRVVYYYRPSPDRTRILFGGRVSAGETDPRISAPRLHRDLVGIFPELAGARVSHSWMGFVAYTFDALAHTGVQDGMHYAMGYCGSGVSMASYLGMRTGQKVLGLAEGRTGFDEVVFKTRPLYTGTPWFLPASVMYYRWRDRAA